MEHEYMNGFDLTPEQLAAARRTEALARKINLLLDAVMTSSARPFVYQNVRDSAKLHGFDLSRTRWSLLLNGKPQVVPDEGLRALAAVFGVDPEFLLDDNGDLPNKVSGELVRIRAKRRSEVLNFAARALHLVDPDALEAIAEVLDSDR